MICPPGFLTGKHILSSILTMQSVISTSPSSVITFMGGPSPNLHFLSELDNFFSTQDFKWPQTAIFDLNPLPQ